MSEKKVSAKELLAQVKKLKEHHKTFKCCVDTREWVENFKPKLEVFIRGCIDKETVEKAMKSKDLAYKTMEKAYIQLAKREAELDKLIEDFPKEYVEILHLPDVERGSCDHVIHREIPTEIKEWFKRLCALKGDIEK